MAIPGNNSIMFKGPEIVDEFVYQGSCKIVNRLVLIKAAKDMSLYKAVYVYKHIAIVYSYFFAVFLDCNLLDIIKQCPQHNNTMVQIVKAAMRLYNQLYFFAVFRDLLHFLFWLLFKAFFPYPVVNLGIEIFYHKRAIISCPQVVK